MLCTQRPTSPMTSTSPLQLLSPRVIWPYSRGNTHPHLSKICPYPFVGGPPIGVPSAIFCRQVRCSIAVCPPINDNITYVDCGHTVMHCLAEQFMCRQCLTNYALWLRISSSSLAPFGTVHRPLSVIDHRRSQYSRELWK